MKRKRYSVEQITGAADKAKSTSIPQSVTVVIVNNIEATEAVPVT
jgi:hypothetical protein